MAKRGSTFSPDLVEAVEAAKRNTIAAAAELRKALDALSSAVHREEGIAERAIQDIEDGAPDDVNLTEAEHEKASEAYWRAMEPARKALERRLRKIEEGHIPDGSEIYNTVKDILRDDCKITLLF